MEDPLDQALRHLVATSPTVAELKQRVLRSFGQGQLQRAYNLAAESKGVAWLEAESEAASQRATQIMSNSSPTSDTPLAMHMARPAKLVLLAGLTILALLLLFPPHIVPLPQGFVSNAGFGSIFSPPQSGELRAIVNVPLLATLVFGVVALTIGATFVANTFAENDA